MKDKKTSEDIKLSDIEEAEESSIESNDSDNIDELQKQADENWDKVLRLQAEIDNLRKRTIKDIENTNKNSIERVFREILPVLDSFELGELVDTSTKKGTETFIEGQNATFKLLQSVLERFSIESINPENMKYDAELHEVISMHDTDQVEPGYIVQVVQKGYRLNQRLLRPARVIVASEKEK
ncbi:MAG TPA: nucleotide exchange factor GrpE [Gammaproteobacteria bacterium]|jgi:molecular chaperone GrpE|nr:nucleotide exchange factor GrpE [Gammaproteobacteria bacterium]HIK76923.1 nucleotide exchange factor GrpE [Gammaproteobacteria bacterium]